MSVEELHAAKLRPKPGLIEQLDEAAKAKRQSESVADLSVREELHPLPLPGDEYVAYSRSSNKPTLSLRFVLADASVRGFSFASLDTFDLKPGEKPGQGPMLVLRFDGSKGTEAVLEGRHLDTLYDHLGDHRIRWVRELPPGRDFLDADKPVINRITFRPVQPGER
jgi:hypothetical protein